jgi:hypothetical protein
MYRSGDILPGIKIKAIITLGVSIMVTLEDEDNNTGSKLFLWDEANSYDFWDSIVFKGETYDIHIDQDEHWAVAIFALSVKDGETTTDMSKEVGINESVDSKDFTIIEACHISGSPVVFEAKEGEGIREYDMCESCEEKTHPDEMVTLPEDDEEERMEICSKCYAEEEKQRVSNQLIEQIKDDITKGDTTVLDMILMEHSKEYLRGCLPEE